MLDRQYNYVVLQYLHDPATFEFVNVGVLMYCPDDVYHEPMMMGRVRTTTGRLREFFPVKPAEFRGLMRRVNARMQNLKVFHSKGDLFIDRMSSSKIAEQILPRDSSSLQWSKMIAGITRDPQETFEKIYHRMVTKYDQRAENRRSDEEIWRPVKQELDRRNLSLNLHPKTISSGDDRIDFQHAWKNGKWHVYEPLSFDLADSDGIYKKAHRWLGQLTSVAPDAQEEFEPYFIVGAPTNPSLHEAFSKAMNILQKSPKRLNIFMESDTNRLVDIIENEVKTHIAESR